jgi:hypothetical protein
MHTCCKMAQARIRGEEVDNGPQKQWCFCVNEGDHL